MSNHGVKAHYIMEKEDEKTVVITDVGTTHMSVTNDAEAVVCDLHEKGILRGRRLFYYDSEGRLDELVHDGHGRFLSFAPGSGKEA